MMRWPDFLVNKFKIEKQTRYMEDLEFKRMHYPRVSDILHPFTRISLENVPIDTLIAAQIRGTTVHKLCGAIVKDIWLDHVDESYKPYIDSFLHIKEKINKVFLYEKRLFDDERQFCGQIDYFLEWEGIPVLLDLKTSASFQKEWNLRLAAYFNLLKINGFEPSKAIVIRLKKDGKKPIINYVDNIDKSWEIFLNCLDCYNYFLRKEDKNNDV